MSELKLAIGSRRKSAVGPDRISYLMFGNMPDVALLVWLRLFNLVWKVGVVPAARKEAHVVPVLKPGKDKSAPSSYRPISLTSQVGKRMECMVKGRLEHLLKGRGVLNRFQSGFRKGRSTLDNLARLHHDVTAAKNRGRYVLAIFLDLQAAFDLTWHFGVLKKLRDCGITRNCFHYLRAFLENRKIIVRVDGELSDALILERSTPHGSVISPVIFSLIINDLPEVAKASGMVISQFADDSGTWRTGSNLVDLAKRA